MSLKPFTYPFPETRFLHAGPNVYKFKIRYGNSIRGEDIENKEVIVQELEDSIRVVLGNLDNLQPFATEHFIVFPSLEKESQEADSSLKVLAERKAAGAMTRKRKRVEVPSSPSRPALDRTKMGISSQGPSKKKPLMDTRRNGERKTQQEWQDTPTFNTTDIQEQALSSPSAISSEGAASEPSRCSREACPLALTSHSVLCHGERGLQTPGVPLWVCLILCPFTMDFFFFFNLKH
ncbi:membrane-anchored junction protein isoform X4 [Mustela erminea]|uniref:membrane-anchored junction protein isoform X4 n=1 Tax=Mustela erminea TaxID=36723 RepID=UPI001387066C|nr:membrane-anchored junction protein isoform X4 [Mustela erminea]